MKDYVSKGCENVTTARHDYESPRIVYENGSDDGDEEIDSCRAERVMGLESVNCYCSSDKCNRATAHSSPSLFTLLLTIAAFLLALIDQR